MVMVVIIATITTIIAAVVTSDGFVTTQPVVLWFTL